MKKDFKEFINGFKTMFTDLKTKGRRHKQIPNLITLSRLMLSCFIPPLVLSGGIVPAGIVALVALGTDFVDGTVARKLNAISEFGKNLDPVCDKLSAAILLTPLMIKASPLITLSLCANLGLEAGISLVNLNSKAKGNMPRTTILGKIKTASLSALLVSSYLSFSNPAFASMIPCIELITIGLQTSTLIDYKRIDKKQDKRREIIEICEKENIQSITEPKKANEKPNKVIEPSLTKEELLELRKELVRDTTTNSNPDKRISLTNNGASTLR